MPTRVEVHTTTNVIIPNLTDGQQFAARSIVRAVDVMALLSLSLSLKDYILLSLAHTCAYIRLILQICKIGQLFCARISTTNLSDPWKRLT